MWAAISGHRAGECGVHDDKLRDVKTPSMRRASWTGTSMFMAASATLRPTGAPASWQTRAMARSRGNARQASTPPVRIEHAAAGATARAKREGHEKAAPEQDAEV
eukprot:s3852_g7.t1